MDCEHWPCINAYTRCDNYGLWNCPNGADEANCSSNPCGPDSHPCILPYSYKFTCLPLSQSNDNKIDCLGGYDERDQCSSWTNPVLPDIYRCFNETKCLPLFSVCDSKAKEKDCAIGDDEAEWCTMQYNVSNWTPAIDIFSSEIDFDMRWYLLRLATRYDKSKVIDFKLTNHVIYPTTIDDSITIDLNPIIRTRIARSDESNSNSDRRSIDDRSYGFCNRGVLLIHSNDSIGKCCLCPPAYFGYRCEYQSQRVSLTLQFRTTEWRTLFNFVIMLIDNNTKIHSYDQIDYLPVRDCRKKFNIYLLYSTRPKLSNETYYVRIDAYYKAKKEYNFSVFYPIRFSFLPVHRLSFQVDIPVRRFVIKSKHCLLQCLHGQCTRFVNSERFFCRCSNGYSGTICSIKNDCNCSPDSICVGTINNRSICVCPLDKFGPRCYLKRTVCMLNPCHNGGRCVATDVRISESEFFCVCSEGFFGSRCENTEMKIEFRFAQNIVIPQSILIHFIDIERKDSVDKNYPINPKQTTMISKIGFDQSSAFIYYGGKFHLIFIEFNKNYYLALLQHNYTVFTNISTTIIREHRCAPISELLDNHIRNFSRWHRAKYYHIPCQKRSDLLCFYDNDQFMCLCDADRHANCFKFNYDNVYNCFGYNYCENGGHCYQDNNTCPTSSSCFCTECYYGNQCQFTSTGYGLSLDDILGYSIWPNVPFSRQPIAVKISTSFTIIIFVIGISNSLLSIITFRTKRSLEVGCGLYLLSSSITSFVTMTMFSWKFLLLVLSQMSIITNHSFLQFKCIIMDMFFKSFLASGDWLNACVAIERVLTIRTGVNFNKKKSKKMAKWIIFGIYLFTLTSYLHDPLHRSLATDNEEQRKWCVVSYSPSIKILASFINIFHFLVPLSINVITILFIIILMARQKLKIRGKQTYKQHLWEQFQQHKHRLFSSFILIIIAMPRLIISFVSDCMKSARNPWLYLGGYFLSFVPPLLAFIIFVLPSEFYRKEFNEATIHIKNTIQRRLRRA